MSGSSLETNLGGTAGFVIERLSLLSGISAFFVGQIGEGDAHGTE